MYKELKKFNKNELIFDGNETKEILIFFWGLSFRQLIQQMQINDDARGFAQGLLIEAIDASHEMGFVKTLFESTANPTLGFRKLLKKFIKGSAKNWFKHASVNDALHAKIYDSIRIQLASNFKTHLLELINLAQLKSPRSTTFASYEKPKKGAKIWA